MSRRPKIDIPDPPGTLGDAGRRLWDRVHSEFLLADPHQVQVLFDACLQADRAAAAGDLVREHGILVKDRFGQLRENEAVKIERAAHNQIRLQLRELGLDHVSTDSNRPPRIGGQH